MIKQHPTSTPARHLMRRSGQPPARRLWAVVGIAVLATALSGYLWYLHAAPGAGPLCDPGSACDILRQSEQARIAGVPALAYGAAASAGVAALALAPLRGRTVPLVVLTGAQVGIFAYLTWVQATLRIVSPPHVVATLAALLIALLVASRPAVRRRSPGVLYLGGATACAVAFLAALGAG